MTENLDAYAKESGQDPAEIIKFYQENFKELFPIIDQVSVAGDAINLFKKWENEYSNDGQYSILDALMIFNDLKLISAQGYESTLLLLDYASRHGVIELDCSSFVGDANPQQQDPHEERERGATKEETIHQNLMLAIYKQQLYNYFGSPDSVSVSPESIKTQLEVASKLRSCTYEELLKMAGIDASAHSSDSLSDQVERYIKNLSDTGDWQFDLENIRNLLKQSVMLFVQAAIDTGKYPPERWHVLAEELWQDVVYRLGGGGGIHNVCSILESPPLNSALLAEKFLQTLKSGGGYSEWENAVSHAYFDLKKHILLQARIQSYPEVEDYADWFIHDYDQSSGLYFADTLNKRVLDLWNLTEWRNEFEKPIQYLRSESGQFVVASWHHPNGDSMGDRGKESCYYLVDNDGVTIIREHNDVLNLSNEIDLNVVAMSIIKDVMGECDMDKISEVFFVYPSINDQEFVQGSITRKRLINAMVNEWIVNCYYAPDEGDDSPEVRRKEFESMTNDQLLESTGCDEIYTIHSFVGRYQQISDVYLQAVDSSSNGTKATISREKSLVTRVVDFLRRVRNKIRRLFKLT